VSIELLNPFEEHKEDEQKNRIVHENWLRVKSAEIIEEAYENCDKGNFQQAT